MKKILLFGLAFMIGFATIAQVAKVKSGIYGQNFKKERMITKESKAPTSVTPFKSKFSGLKSGGNRSIVTILNLGTSANSLGYSGGTRTMLWADDDLNVVANFHRMGPGATPPSLSGYLAMDLGLNMGATQGDWTNQIQVLAATMTATPYYYDASRYPSIGIYNPVGNLDLSNAFLAYFAPNFCNTIVSGFGGYSYGTANLVDHADTTKHLRWYAPPPYTYVTEGFTVTNTGFAHMVNRDINAESGSEVYQDSIIYGRGVWNTTTNDFDYTFKTFAFIDAHHYQCADVAIDASEDGNTVWMAALTQLIGSTPLQDSSFSPVLRKSEDGGLTWGNPFTIQLDGPSGIAGIKNHYTQHFIDSIFGTGTNRNTIPYTTAFDLSIKVDKWGNPHIGCVVGYAVGAYSVAGGNVDSLYGVYDIYSVDKGAHWQAVCMGDLKTFRGTWAGAGGDQAGDNRTYCAKTKSGDKMFFTWNDTHVEGDVNNDQPDIFARGFDLIANKITADQYGANQPNYVTFLSDIYNQCYYQCTSHYIFTDNDKYTIPMATEWWSDPALDVTFKYIPDFSYVDADFSIATGNDPFPVGIDQKNIDIASVSVYPNPVKDIAKVSVNLKQNANVSVDITNLVGQQVMSLNKGNMSAGSQQFTIDASSLTSGVYFITVKVNGEKYTQKLIVE